MDAAKAVLNQENIEYGIIGTAPLRTPGIRAGLKKGEHKMIEVAKNLFIGNQDEYEYKVKGNEGWTIVHACKEPYHRDLLGYTSRGAPKTHPEYLLAKRGDCLFLNIVDVESPDYIAKDIIDAALMFIREALKNNCKCLVHCNQGESRSPSIGLLYLAINGSLSKDFVEAENEFRKLYPSYNPKNGIRGFIINHWNEYIEQRL